MVRPLVWGSARPQAAAYKTPCRAAAARLEGAEPEQPQEERPDAAIHPDDEPDDGRRQDDQEQPGPDLGGQLGDRQIGLKVLHQWATLGAYDFVSVVEAPDAATMARASVELGSRGTTTNHTLTAIPAEEFAKPVGGRRETRAGGTAR